MSAAEDAVESVQIPSDTFMQTIESQSALILFDVWPSASRPISAVNGYKIEFDASMAKDTPLLDGLPISDIARVQAEVKRHYWVHWPRVSERSRLYRARVMEVLEEMGAPEALQVLPIVESGYNPYALSWAGASGLWQLMPGTARHLDVRHRRGFDGRRDIADSTRGGVQYLMDMYAKFGNWPLAFAAYHRGPNSVARSLRKRPWKPEDGLDKLPVRSVTRHYVRHVLGFAALYHTGGLEFPEPLETGIVNVNVPVDIAVLSTAAGMKKTALFDLNPGLDYSQYAKGLNLHVPEEHVDAVRMQLADATPKIIRVSVRRGDSLWKIAKKHHTTVARLRRLNPSMRDLLRPGDRLLVPSGKYVTRLASTPNPLLSRGNRIRYTVRRGDSLWRIAQRFGTTPRAIARSNQISEDKLIRPGDKLWVLARTRPS
ncbi:MAG: LysM peptidoglycan-binding domain-containing protein [Mariprofundaceae bacterium]